MQSLNIQGFSYAEQNSLLPSLVAAIGQCGGWLLDKRTLSSGAIEFDIEIQLRSAVDLYAALVASGLELTRATHLALTSLCTCRKQSVRPSQRRQLVAIRLEVSFLEDITLRSLLTTGSALA
jgi:hypothetical protein